MNFKRAIPALTTAALLAGCMIPTTGLSGFDLLDPSGSAIRPMSNSFALAIGEEKEGLLYLRSASGTLSTMALVWTSSNTTVATVSPDTGRIKAVGKGEAIITATSAANANQKVSFSVSVVEKHAVTLIQVKPSVAGLVVGKSLELTAEVTLADGQRNGNVTWSSSDDTIATVNPTTGVVFAIKPGKVSILASYSPDPKYRGLAEITVALTEALLPPSPTPSTVTFGPSATPIPTTSPTTSTGNEQPGSSTDNTSTSGSLGTSGTAPMLNRLLKQFPRSFTLATVGENFLCAHDGTTSLHISTNGGNSWKTYTDVGSQNITSTYWESASKGVVGTENGTLLDVTLDSSGNLAYQVRGKYNNWAVAVADYEGRLFVGDYWSSSVVVEPGSSGAIASQLEGKPFVQAAGALVGAGGSYVFKGGLTLPIAIQGKPVYVRNPGSASSAAMVSAEYVSTLPNRWYVTEDFENYAPIPNQLVTSTEILSGSLEKASAYSKSIIFGITSGNYPIKSVDGGKTWSNLGLKVGEAYSGVDTLIPVSSSKVLIMSGSKLYLAY